MSKFLLLCFYSVDDDFETVRVFDTLKEAQDIMRSDYEETKQPLDGDLDEGKITGYIDDRNAKLECDDGGWACNWSIQEIRI